MNFFDKPIFEMKFINVEYIFYKIYLFFKRFSGGGGGEEVDYNSLNNNTNEKVLSNSSTNFSFDFGIVEDILKFILFLFILFLIGLIVYIIVRLTEIREKEHHYLHEELEKHKEMQLEKSQKSENISKNSKWIKVVEYMNSKNENDWKLAIIECDLMLDSLLNSLGFKGENIGEKLKSINKEKYQVLNSVWEAHNVRNRIAHEGSDFFISHNEAKRTVGKYEEVFRHYNYI